MTYALRRVDALAKRLPYLTIVVGDAAHIAGFTVTANTRRLSPNEFGAAIPVDPGTQAIIARAPGHESQRVTLKLAEGESRTVELTVMKQLDDSPQDSAGAAGKTPTTRLVGYTLVGVGAATMLARLYFGGVAYRDLQDVPAECREFVFPCRTEENQQYESALTNATRSTYSSVIGGALLTTGAALWWVSRSGRSTGEQRTSVAPSVTGDGVGWTVTGTF